MAKILIAFLLCMSIVAPARAADGVGINSLEDGYAAWHVGDYATALQYWRPLAEQGDVDAQSAIGFMFYNGQGVPQDYRQALMWYRRAAEQGNSLAQNNLGLMYANGHGVPRDPVRAHMWFNLAAATATGEARESAIDNRDLFARDMTPQQIERAQALAWKCMQAKFKNCE